MLNIIICPRLNGTLLATGEPISLLLLTCAKKNLVWINTRDKWNSEAYIKCCPTANALINNVSSEGCASFVGDCKIKSNNTLPLFLRTRRIFSRKLDWSRTFLYLLVAVLFLLLSLLSTFISQAAAPVAYLTWFIRAYIQYTQWGSLSREHRITEYNRPSCA